ncbi:MAG TPA: response regulator [Alphaproteobacteria bacterium]|nr:response regulator [Alphaproteobacteria bacterium]
MAYDLEQLKVLVVEDNEYMRGLVRRLLYALGVRGIREVSNGEEAIAQLEHFTPDLVLTDWLMEPGDGLELTRYLRTSPDSPDAYVPVIMMTGYSAKPQVIQARDAGVTEFLAKPISVKTLCERIISVIETPRPFVRTKTFFGPCRRRHTWSNYMGPERRCGEDSSDRSEEMELDRLLGSL